MILQRLTTALRKQDWFTVAVETLIVVFGVFIGLQVNNWNEARVERGVEAQILSRLQDEIPTLMAMRTADRQFAMMRREGLATAVRKVFDPQNDEELTRIECLSVTLSHIYSIPPDDLPMVTELLSTGSMAAIRDDEVRHALSSFVLARNRGRQTQASVSIDIRQLAVEFPDIIEPGYAIPEDGSAPVARPVCRTDAMRQSKAFRSTLVSNHQRFLSYIDAVFAPVDTELEALLAVIEGDTDVSE